MQVTERFILRSSLLLASGNFAIRFLSYLYRILLGRSLSPADYGMLSIALSVQYLMIVFSSSGIAPSVAKFVASSEEKEEKSRIACSASVYYALIGIIFAFLLFLLADFIAFSFFRASEMGKLIKITAFSIPSGLAIASFSGVLQGEKKMGLMSALLITEQIFIIVLSLFFINLNLGAAGAALGSSLGFLAAGIFGIILLYLSGFRISLSYSYSKFREIFYFSLPVSLAAIATFLLAYIDVLLLGFFKTSFDVGIYSAASPTSRLILAFSAALYATLLPSIAELKQKKSYNEIKKSVKFASMLQIVFILPFIFVSFLFSEEIITLLFGSAYASAASSFKILVIANAFLSTFISLSAVLQAMDMQAVPAKILIFSAVLNVILNIILIPRYSLLGAAFSTLIASLFAFLALAFILLRTLKKEAYSNAA